MKHRIMKVSVILLLCVLLNGCGSNSSIPSDDDSNGSNAEVTQLDESVTEKAKENAEQEDNEQASDDSFEQESTQIEPPVTIEVPFYTISSDDSQTKATVANVPEDTEITAELIVQLVLSDFADKSYVITVDEVSNENGNTIIDFSTDTPPIVNVGADVETTILDALAFSILDNLSDCSGVIFRAGGQAYQSENYNFEYDEIYSSR